MFRWPTDRQSTLRQTTAVKMSTVEWDRRNLLLTVIISCVDNTRMTPKANKRRDSFFLQWQYFCYYFIFISCTAQPFSAVRNFLSRSRSSYRR